MSFLYVSCLEWSLSPARVRDVEKGRWALNRLWQGNVLTDRCEFSEFEQQEMCDLVKCRKCCQAGPGCSMGCAKAGFQNTSRTLFSTALGYRGFGLVLCKVFFPLCSSMSVPPWVGWRCCTQAVLELLCVRFPTAQEDLTLEFICVPMAHEPPWLLSCPWSVSGDLPGSCSAPACSGLPAPPSYSRRSPNLFIAALKYQSWKVTYKGNLLGRIPSRSSSSITP